MLEGAMTRGESVFSTLAIDKIHEALNCLSCPGEEGEVDPRAFEIGVDRVGWAQLGGKDKDADLSLVGQRSEKRGGSGGTGLLNDKRFRVVLVEELPRGSICLIWKNL